MFDALNEGLRTYSFAPSDDGTTGNLLLRFCNEKLHAGFRGVPDFEFRARIGTGINLRAAGLALIPQPGSRRGCWLLQPRSRAASNTRRVPRWPAVRAASASRRPAGDLGFFDISASWGGLGFDRADKPVAGQA
jgi:hypothetical protein